MDAQDKARLRQKNGLVIAAVAQARPGGGQFAVATPHGNVNFERIATATDAEGVEYLEIYLAGDTESGDPHFRIYNPPTAVDDPNGTIIGRDGQRRLRQDPLLAVALAVAGRGGQQKGTRR